jgi:hypothetical protein
MGPDETVINPGTGDGQASTAYDAPSDEGAGEAPGGSAASAVDNGTSPMADENEHGRDFGTSHHEEHGHDPIDAHGADGDGGDPIDPAG